MCPIAHFYRTAIMKRFSHSFTAIAMLTALVLGTTAFAAAQKRNQKEVSDAIRTLSSKLDDFESHLRYQMQSSSASSTKVSDITDLIRTMRDNVGQFQDNFDHKKENASDVTAIIDSTRPISDFLRANSQNRGIEDDWAAVQRQIDRLAANYGVVNKWNDRSSAPQVAKDPADTQTAPTNSVSVGLSGTYTIDRQRSESIDEIIADTKVTDDKRQDLKDKLDSPEQIAIDVRGSQITLATTNSSPVTFAADGKETSETSPTGKNVRLRATLSGQALTVSSLGGETDYTITFTSVSDGQGMKVSRRITTDYLTETVFAESVYNKTDAVAKLGIPASGSTGSGNTGSVNTDSGNTGGGNSTESNSGGYSDNDTPSKVANGGSPNSGGNRPGPANSPGAIYRPGPRTVQVKPGNYTVPDGTMMTGTLENVISTKVSQNNDRFRMTVQSPNEFRGAVVEGYVTGINRSGRITGQSNIVFNFEKITLQNGTTYDFAATLRGITDITGRAVQVDNEGTARGDNQSRQTAKRGGIGAGLGAVIGAIAGGAQGAAIGAIIGAGGGAASTAAQGRNDLQLPKGSVMTIQAAAPLK